MRRPCCLLLLGLAACAPAPLQRPDILLVSLDTFRADLLEETAPRFELPALEAIAAESRRFTNAFAPMAFTLPSHMTMMTSLHPESHGVTTQHDRLATTVPTLAERLHALGYDTSAIVGGSWLKARFGFDRGFDRYVELPVDLTFADRVVPFVLERLTARPAGSAPRFVFAHFFDPHSDWSSQGNRLTYYSPPVYRGDLAVPAGALCDDRGRCATDYLRFAEREARPLSEAELALHHELYRRGVRYLDDRLGELVDELRRRGVWQRAAVVVVADHGEEFREHGKLLHSQVYRESLQVPLLVRPPGGDSRRRPCPRLVGLADVAPTLAAMAGAAPAPGWQGRNLQAPCEELAASHVEVGRDKLIATRFSLRTVDRLLVWDFGAGPLGLYERPSETTGLAFDSLDSPELAVLRERLIAELRRLRSAGVDPERSGEPAFSAAEEESLRSLGYL